MYYSQGTVRDSGCYIDTSKTVEWHAWKNENDVGIETSVLLVQGGVYNCPPSTLFVQRMRQGIKETERAKVISDDNQTMLVSKKGT